MRSKFCVVGDSKREIRSSKASVALVLELSTPYTSEVIGDLAETGGEDSCLAKLLIGWEKILTLLWVIGWNKIGRFPSPAFKFLVHLSQTFQDVT